MQTGPLNGDLPATPPRIDITKLQRGLSLLFCDSLRYFTLACLAERWNPGMYPWMKTRLGNCTGWTLSMSMVLSNGPFLRMLVWVERSSHTSESVNGSRIELVLVGTGWFLSKLPQGGAIPAECGIMVSCSAQYFLASTSA